MSRSVKVTVDYDNGCYNITGSVLDGKQKNTKKLKILQIHRPIRGTYINGTGKEFFKASYSRRLLKLRKEEIKKYAIPEILKKERNFKYSNKLLKNVDTMMYKTLQDWDSRSQNTSYALDYLKAVTRQYDRSDFPGLTRREFKKRCKEKRKEELEKAGIEMAYHIGLLNGSKDLNIIDKLVGIRIAMKQNKILDTKVFKSLILKSPLRLSCSIPLYQKDLNLEYDKPKMKNSKSKVRTRRIDNTKDSIKNKKTNINKTKLRKIIIRSTAAAMATGAVIFGAYHNSKDNNNNKTSKVPVNTTFDKEDNGSAFDELGKNSDDVIVVKPIDKNNIEIKTEKTTETVTETEKSKETEVTEAITETEKDKETEITEAIAETEKDKETEIAEAITETEKDKETEIAEAITETEKDRETELTETEKTAKPQVIEQAGKITNKVKKANKTTEIKKVNKKEKRAKKLAKFKKLATQKYMQAFVIGEKPSVGNMLDDKSYSQTPEGTGTKGYFKTHPNYKIGHIEIKTKDDDKPKREELEGTNLLDILDKYPDNLGYSIHFISSEPGNGGLGFVTEEELEKMINDKIDSIIESKETVNLEEDLMR